MNTHIAEVTVMDGKVVRMHLSNSAIREIIRAKSETPSGGATVIITKDKGKYNVRAISEVSLLDRIKLWLGKHFGWTTCAS